MSEEAIRFEVTRDRRDYMSALWANYFVCGGVWWSIGAGVFLALFAAIMNLSKGHEPGLAMLLVALLFGGAALVLSFASQALMIWLTASRNMRAISAADPAHYTLTPETLSVQSAMGEGKTKWETWRQAFETPRVIVIRHQLNLLHILPKRQIAAGTQIALKGLLARVLNGKVKFKPEPAA